MLTDNDLKSYIGSYYQDRKITYTKLDKHDRAIGVLLEENKRLHSIIKEAIEYIEERYNGEVLTHTFDKDNVGELLEILKGSDKEWGI